MPVDKIPAAQVMVSGSPPSVGSMEAREFRAEPSMTTSSRVAVVRLCDVLPLLDADRHMGKREAAEFLGLGIRTLEGLLDQVPHFRVGSKVLFRRSELIAWMDRHREHTTSADLGRIADDAVRAVLGEKRNSQLDGHRNENRLITSEKKTGVRREAK